MTDRNKTLIIITGPTASGKTELSIKLAQIINTEIISADSRQFYREMKIGTAVPTEKQMNTVPHHFIGHLSIHEQYNVSDFEQDILIKLDELFQQYNYVILTGGSGLYLDAVSKGIDDMPDIPAEIRKSIDHNYREHGLNYLREYLKKVDPVYYSEVDINNPNRMKRGVEVFEATGKPFSSFRKKTSQKRDFKILKFGLLWERKLLNDRINRRTEEMMRQRWLEEAKALIPFRHLNALNTVGYKELFAYIDGEMNLEQAVDKIKTQTRRYAKRQMTWLKRDPDIYWVDIKDDPVDYILRTIDRSAV
ncbi:MAG: tRNA (adenosine(37)-N6)-dimethylallyltransferase MiaA [Bacteroidales bacterium]|nr:tRNA (adenosine(37)-N6)-dimethylallyltransferase MiaA [Bacteroidales bacterium]